MVGGGFLPPPSGNQKHLRMSAPCPYQRDVRMAVTCQHQQGIPVTRKRWDVRRLQRFASWRMSQRDAIWFLLLWPCSASPPTNQNKIPKTPQIREKKMFSSKNSDHHVHTGSSVDVRGMFHLKMVILSHVQLFATPQTVAHQVPLSMQLSR